MALIITQLLLLLPAAVSATRLEFISPHPGEQFIGAHVETTVTLAPTSAFEGYLCVVLNNKASCSHHTVAAVAAPPFEYNVMLKLRSPGHHRLIGVALPSNAATPISAAAVQAAVSRRAASASASAPHLLRTEVAFRTLPMRTDWTADERPFLQRVHYIDPFGARRHVALAHGADPSAAAATACASRTPCILTLTAALEARVALLATATSASSSEDANETAALGQLASDYVFNRPESGRIQFAILASHGLRPHHRLLELGCGTLNLARLLLAYLDAGNYVCIEPNDWLVEAALLNDPALLRRAIRKRAVWLQNEHFDARELLSRDDDGDDDGVGFDVVWSHSILSHASAAQLPEYLDTVGQVLRPNGIALASLYLHALHGDGTILVGDSNDENWVYPGVSTFLPSTVVDAGARCASAPLVVSMRPEIRAFVKRHSAVEVRSVTVMNIKQRDALWQD